MNDKRMNDKRRFEWLRWGMLIGVMAWNPLGLAQDAANHAEQSSADSHSNTSENDSIRELQEQVRELQAAVAGMHSDWQQARSETAELRRELGELRSGAEPRSAVLRDAVARSTSASMPMPVPDDPVGRLREVLANALPGISPNVSSDNAAQSGEVSGQATLQKNAPQDDQRLSGHAASAEEEYQLLSGKVDDQYQTKVESASKYRLRVSGIVLMNLFSNQGVVDNIDLPTLAYARPPGDSGGSFGATLRQSEIGFETFGPTLAGAKTKADLQLDLAGGFPSVPNGINSGLMRLRTATMRMDWTNTSVVVGQDTIFFAPNSPTSFASLAIPALSAAGNLWAWVPQIRVEHRVDLGGESSLLFQGGILDPVSGETPTTGPYRQAGPGEQSRQPAYATRIAYSHNIYGQPLRLGVGGYYSRQDYGFGQNVDGWAGMADLALPLGRQFSLTGAVYRGRALGGLYASGGASVAYSGAPGVAGTQVQALDSVGGWSQLKYRPANKWEFNAAFGMDNPYASDLEYFPSSEPYELARNRASFVNMIYRPRSDLLFSAEYRRLMTYPVVGDGNSAGHLNLMMGVLF